MRKLYLLLIFFSLLVGVDAAAQTIRYVKPGGTGDGSSWTAASGDLQAVINASAAGNEIWVAAGTYKPNRKADAVATVTPNDRYNAFVLKKDISIYGGFAGTETSRLQRNFNTNVTILSGNLGDETIDTDNAYHVVVASGDLGTAKLDGFTVSKGYTSGTGTTGGITVNGNVIPPSRSPGIINYYSSAAYENLIIRDNVNGSTDQSAGAIYILYGSPTYTKVKFINNKTLSTNAGAIFIFSAVATPSKPVFTEVEFIGNESTAGGAVVASTAASPVFERCTFDGNKSSTTGGAIHMFSASASMTFNECNFINNTATTNGGAINNGLATTITISKSTFSNNSSVGSGGAVYFTAGTLNLTESTFTGNKASSSGAIYLGTSTLPSVLNGLTFLNNEATTTAGALYLNANSPQMNNNKFIGNKAATSGGAIYLFGVAGNLASPVLISNLFYNNEAASNSLGGGAIYVSTNAAPVIHNATFYANKATAFKGGAVYVTASGQATVYNSIVYKNQATDATTVDFFTATAANLTIKSSMTDVYGTNGVDDNIVGQDPVFESEDPNSPDFLRLQDFSPAIDAGQNNLLPTGVTTDLAGNSRVNNLILDLGAYEFDGAAPVPPLQVAIDENSPNGTFVAKPVSSLPGVLSNWTIMSGNVNDAFAINAATGNITVNKSTEVDYEKIKSFNLTIKVFNDVGDDQVMRVIISVNNLMEDPQAPIVAKVANGVLTSFRPKLSGLAEPLSVITIYVDNKEYPVTATSNDKGEWVYTFIDELAPGKHTFHVVASNSLGTSNPSPQTTVTLKLYSGSVIANNLLTPNGDGKNDLWIVTDLSLMYPKNEVTVYDKTGKTVFKKANYQSDWDGSYNGTPLNTGTYYYEINIGAGLKPIKGTLTILKGR
ncbi:gliding motility-associated C-terminal domain-containing protein [Pedobacter sp.]|uniref:T9SS type B sorting domain-containing protein n=1 Tax=Pedobacter sp. TaxID=1411316 RepID=UPI0031DFFEBE